MEAAEKFSTELGTASSCGGKMVAEKDSVASGSRRAGQRRRGPRVGTYGRGPEQELLAVEERTWRCQEIAMDPEETDGYVNDCLMLGTIGALSVFPNLNG